MTLSKTLKCSIFLAGFVSLRLWADSNTVLAKIESDYQAALNGAVAPNINDSIAFAGGMLIRTAKTQLKYVYKDEAGKTQSALLNPTDNLSEVAAQNPKIRQAWIDQYGVDLAGQSNPSTKPKSTTTDSNLEYVKNARESSLDMLIKATVEYKAGSLSKDKYIEVAMQAGQMAAYYGQVNIQADGKGPSTSSVSETAKLPTSDLVLIGTANNGKSKIYSIKQNSWETKYGYKVRIIPDNPDVSPYYDLVIQSPNPSATLQTDPNYLLSKIPDSFKVDKAADGKPVATFDKNNTAGMWTVDNESPPLSCVNEGETEPQPRGSCSKIGEKKTISASGFGNELIPAHKKCLDQGFKKWKILYTFTCTPDFYSNKAGM